MTQEAYNFYSIASGILKIFLLLTAGYALYAKGLIRKGAVTGLSNILVWVCLPALIFIKITSTFNPFDSKWWILPICSIGMSLLGLCVGYLFQKPFCFSSRREFISSCAFQNSGYLPMTLVAFISQGVFRDRMLVYIFLFIMGFNVLLWSFAPGFLSKGFKGNFRPRAILNAPIVVTLFSILWVLAGKGRVHSAIHGPLLILGNASFPMALIMLGAYLAEYRGFIPENWKVLLSCVFGKLIFLPVVVFLLINYLPLGLDNGLKFFILMEATMPAAVSLVIVGQYANADNKFFSGAIFYSHLLAIATIPLWLMIFRNALNI